MARIYQPTSEEQAAYDGWVAARPPVVRTVAERLNPWTLYRLKDTGQRVFVVSFFEDGTVMIAVTAEYNLLSFERQVFGINPDDLEECDLPGPEEVVGLISVLLPTVETLQ